MRRFVTLNYLNNTSETTIFPSNVVEKLKYGVLVPISSKPNIQEALHRSNFIYHRACSIVDLIRECNAGEGRTLLMCWSCASSDSQFTLTMSNASTTSFQASVVPAITPQDVQREKDLRTIAQQTEISCRQSPGFTSPVSDEDSQRELRARIADSLTFSSPAPPPSSQAAARSCSILSSVCALLSLSKQDSTDAPKQAASIASFPSDNICRICFGGESAERLVRPCSCRGTIAGVHRSCLERWLLQASTSYCELCRHHYVVTRTHKWSWLRSLAEWARSGRGRALAADAWRGAALGAASVLGTARALHACDRALQAGAKKGGGAALAANLFSSLLIGIIGALNGLLTTWMLLKIQEHQLSWQAWRDSTLHVHVSLADDPRDIIPLDSDDSQRTVVATDGTTADRGTNVADPFMVALPYVLPEP